MPDQIPSHITPTPGPDTGPDTEMNAGPDTAPGTILATPASAAPVPASPDGDVDDTANGEADTPQTLPQPRQPAGTRAGAGAGEAPGVSTPAFSTFIRSLRPHYTNREDYNLMICNELAAQGQIPSGNLVRDIGGWGSQAYVQADVAKWASQLQAHGVSTSSGRIPAPLLRQTQTIAENMWATVQQHHQQHVAAPLQQQMQTARDNLQQLQQDMHQQSLSHAAAIEHLQESLQHARQELHATRDQLQEARNQLSRDGQELAGVRESLRLHQHRHQQEIDSLQKSAQDAATAAAQKLDQQRSAHQSHTRDMQQAHDKAFAHLQETHAAMERRFTLQVDEARQIARQAQERADKLDAAIATRDADMQGLREQAAADTIQHARELARKDMALQELKMQLQQQHDELKRQQEKWQEEMRREQDARQQALQQLQQYRAEQENTKRETMREKMGKAAPAAVTGHPHPPGTT